MIALKDEHAGFLVRFDVLEHVFPNLGLRVIVLRFVPLLPYRGGGDNVRVWQAI